MPEPFAFRNLDYHGEVVRTFSHDGEVRFVVEDIRRILGDENPGDTLSGPEGHERRPLVEVSSDHPPLMTSIGASGIDALLLNDRRPEAKSLRKWLKLAGISAIREQGHHGNGSKKCDPIQAGLKALIGLRAAQLSRDRHLTALAEAVGLLRVGKVMSANSPFHSFPRSSVGMPSSTLRVGGGRRLSKRGSIGPAKRTRSVQDGIPTQSVGTSESSPF